MKHELQVEILKELMSQLDGVLEAKVHVVMPQSEQGFVTQASASVAIKHSSDVNLEGQITQVKELVANSIPELDYDRVTVALFPSYRKATTSAFAGGASDSRMGKISDERKIIIGVVLLLVVSAAWFFVFGRRKKPASKSRSRG